MSSKIIRTLCYFTDNPSAVTVARLNAIASKLKGHGYSLQTKRVCTTLDQADKVELLSERDVNFKSVSTLGIRESAVFLPRFLGSHGNLFFNVALDQSVEQAHVDLLIAIVKQRAAKTFNLTFVCNNAPSSPFFPSATYSREGFAVGLQTTNLAEHANTLDQWFAAMNQCWQEIFAVLKNEPDFLGIDSSIAPLGVGHASLVHLVKRLQPSFSRSVTTDMYTKMTHFIKSENPQPIGLCGLMLPCLEDAELADEYAAGQFSIERNLFMSLHSGLGVDTYPIGTDEDPARILQILRLTRALSNKYSKPLSVRFVSDGKARIGEQTNFHNNYLVDTIIRPL